MKTYGLIGYPLSHSFSPNYFKNKFKTEGITDCQYNPFPIENINKFPELLKQQPTLRGLNVTIPYKENVIPYLDKLDNTADSIQAVNTIKFENGKLIGYNTDVIGFKKSLEPILSQEIKKALVLGTGGASKAVVYVLNQLGIIPQLVSRKKSDHNITYEEMDTHLISEHLLIINTSPLGMYPNIELCPDIPYESLSDKHVLYDLIYNPETTEFLKQGIKYGAVTKNGLEMLHLQADSSWEIWNA